SSRENLRKYLAVSYWILLAMLVFSLYAFFVSIFVLKTVCLMCCLLYLCIIFMTISAKKALNTPVNSLFKEAWAFFFPFSWSGIKKIHYALFGGLFVASALAALALDGHSRNHYRKVFVENRLQEAAMQGVMGGNREDLLNEQFKRLPQNSFDLSDSPTLGPADAPVVIIEFSDFQCPACAYKAKFFSDLVAEFPGEVKLYYKFYPLDNSCNSQIDSAFHPVACEAARYAYCAYKAGKFWPVHDAFYENHRKLDSVLIKQLLIDNGVSQNVIDNCSGKDAALAVDRDIREANAVKVEYTPTIFLNGRKVSDIIRNIEEVRDLIRMVLHEDNK
ncbi:MAG: DsbA family protein, partial [Bacteroidota bacterium]